MQAGERGSDRGSEASSVLELTNLSRSQRLNPLSSPGSPWTQVSVLCIESALTIPFTRLEVLYRYWEYSEERSTLNLYGSFEHHKPQNTFLNPFGFFQTLKNS